MKYPIPNRVPMPMFRPANGGGMSGAFPPAPPAPAQPMAQAPMQAPQQAQGGGIRSWLGNNSEALAAMSKGLLSGRTADEQFAGGFGGFVDARAAGKKKTKTMEFLAQQDPMTAQAVELGLLTGPEAFKAIYDARNKPTEYQQRAQVAQQYGLDPNTPEGRAFVLTGKMSDSSTKPLSTVGKINADFNAGLIDKATRDALVAKAGQSEGMELISDGQGGFTMRQGPGVGGGKPMRESEAKANIFASRGEIANDILSNVESQGTDLIQTIVSGAPLGNYALSPEYRQYDQAKRDFLNAILRQESGAVIAQEEFENGDKQYFPQPGDDAATIAQKRRNRETAIKAIREASGRPAPTQAQQPQGGVIPAEDYFR